MFHDCTICGNNTITPCTLHFFTSYRCEDKDYIKVTEEGAHRAKGYFEILRFCPACLRKYCVGRKDA